MLIFDPDDADFAIQFAVDFDHFDHHQSRWRYRYRINVDGEDIAHGGDLACGATSEDQPEPLATMLGTLLGFFSAYIEATTYAQRTGRASENDDLFPDTCRPLAEALDADLVALWADDIRGADP